MLVMGRVLRATSSCSAAFDESFMGLAPILGLSRSFQIVEDLHEGRHHGALVEQNARWRFPSPARIRARDRQDDTMTGTGQELLHDDNVRKAYLGG